MSKENNFEIFYHLRLGYIVECKVGKEYGIVYQYKGEGWGAKMDISKIFFFYKDKVLEIPSKTLVSFLAKTIVPTRGLGFVTEDSEVSDIEKLSNYSHFVVTSENEENQVFEKMQDDTSKFSVIVKESESTYSYLYYPMIDIQKKVQYISLYSASDMIYEYSYPTSIFESFAHIKAYEEYIKYPGITAIKKKIDNLYEYVSALGLDNIKNFFSVTDSGEFQCRPGRDDHFYYKKNRICSSSDIYLNQLTKLGSEIIRTESGIGLVETDFEHENIEETKVIRKEIEQNYNQSEHILFLIKHFLSEIDKIHDITQIAIRNLSFFIKEGDEHLFEIQPTSLNEWKDIINSHNKFY